MTTFIQSLPIEVVHLMAAGEVIDSLAAAVRELVENALDAGATRISVALWTDQWRVRVADNGKGMTLSDLRQAALPHCTSKIQHKADLWQIRSLGFRGEALHSLAQLSDVEICSRDTETDTGYRICYDHQGEPYEVEPIAIAPGTIVIASHLFGNWTSRRQSLPAPAQQLRSVQLVIQHLALCHPQVTWQVEQNDRPWFSIGGNRTAKPILSQLLREVQPSDLQELRVEIPWSAEQEAAELPNSNALYLLFGLPDRCHRHRPDWIKVAVNGRVVQLPALEQAVLAAFRRTLPRERHPVCFLHLQVSPDQVDWNRHPAKAEIYLRQLEQWQTQVKQSITEALQSSLVQFPDSAYVSQVGQLLKAAEAEGVYRTSRSIQEQPSAAGSEQESSLENPIEPEFNSELEQPLIPLKAVAQVHRMYILAEHPAGMWLIEQHIAHERVLYEQLSDRWQIVPSESPVILEHLSDRQLTQLQRLGIAVEPFGEQRWAARSAPEALIHRDDCADALLELSQGGDLESALVATACRTAIRNGTLLSLPEMQILLEQWQRTRNPRTCPHGRPIYLPLDETGLARFFRRHWVIGKSHGI